MRELRQCLSLTLVLLAMTYAEGHIDSDGYETYTKSSRRTVINSFKVFEEPMTWDDANDKCVREGADLVDISKDERRDVLELLLNKLPNLSQRKFHVIDPRRRYGFLGKLRICGTYNSSFGSSTGECSAKRAFVCEKNIADDKPGQDPRIRN